MKVGRLQKGRLNHLLDVPGGTGLVHRSYRDASKGVCTGFTVIHPTPMLGARCAASVSPLNGVGELAGSHQIQEWGFLETPIILTNTIGVGRAYEGVCQWMMEKNPEIGNRESVIIPVVGETNDQVLHDPRIIPWGYPELSEALNEALEMTANRTEETLKKALLQGDVGSGTGTIAFDLKAGIGSSSRVVKVRDQQYTVGVLLQTNFGVRQYLQILGRAIGDRIDLPMPAQHCEGSCIGILATDAPIDAHALRRLAARMGMGLVRTGSVGHDSSGEIMLAYSTDPNPRHDMSWGDDEWNPLFWAATEASEEAVYQSLFHAKAVENIRATVPAISDANLDFERLV